VINTNDNYLLGMRARFTYMKIDFENEVLDLTALREEQLLNENILNVFAAWIQYLLSKMYKGRRIPVRVRGNKIEVERFTDTLVNEKRYMDYIKKYGLDDPMTYKQKSKLDIAIKRFEREAGINWPIRN
tara:strand:+ start:148 stop:534 length:387 start_codon:yes stop_codon:yes gene_type:complete